MASYSASTQAVPHGMQHQVPPQVSHEAALYVPVVTECIRAGRSLHQHLAQEGPEGVSHALAQSLEVVPALKQEHKAAACTGAFYE